MKTQRLAIRRFQKTLRRLNCKHNQRAKEKGHCTLSSTFWTLFALQNIYITKEYFPILTAHIGIRRTGPATFVEMHCFIFNT